MLKNPLFCFFASFLIVWLTSFINKPDSSRQLIIFEIINVVTPDPNIFLWIAESVAYVAAVNPNGIKTLLCNGLSMFPTKVNLVFSNGPKSLPENAPDCPILCN